jgi:hypothetical protein
MRARVGRVLFRPAPRAAAEGTWGFTPPGCSDKIDDERYESAVTRDEPSPPSPRAHRPGPGSLPQRAGTR